MTLNILCVDDEGFVLDSLKRYFADFMPGASIDTAINCSIALHKAGETRYDLVTVDGLDGKCFELIENLKKKSQENIVILSSNTRIIDDAKRKKLLHTISQTLTC